MRKLYDYDTETDWLTFLNDGTIEFQTRNDSEYNILLDVDACILNKEETKDLYSAMRKHYDEEERKTSEKYPPFTSQLDETPQTPYTMRKAKNLFKRGR